MLYCANDNKSRNIHEDCAIAVLKMVFSMPTVSLKFASRQVHTGENDSLVKCFQKPTNKNFVIVRPQSLINIVNTFLGFIIS